MTQKYIELMDARRGKKLLPPCGHCGHRRYNQCGCIKVKGGKK